MSAAPTTQEINELIFDLRSYRSAGVRGARLTICDRAADMLDRFAIQGGPSGPLPSDYTGPSEATSRMAKVLGCEFVEKQVWPPAPDTRNTQGGEVGEAIPDGPTDRPEWLIDLKNIVDDIEDEGDRTYFGSTNDADTLREVVVALEQSALPLRYFKRPDLHRHNEELRQENARIRAALSATTAGDELLREALGTLRQREFQMMGAAISLRDWHALEAAYNQARDRMDRDPISRNTARLGGDNES